MLGVDLHGQQLAAAPVGQARGELDGGPVVRVASTPTMIRRFGSGTGRPGAERTTTTGRSSAADRAAVPPPRPRRPPGRWVPRRRSPRRRGRRHDLSRGHPRRREGGCGRAVRPSPTGRWSRTAARGVRFGQRSGETGSLVPIRPRPRRAGSGGVRQREGRFDAGVEPRGRSSPCGPCHGRAGRRHPGLARSRGRQGSDGHGSSSSPQRLRTAPSRPSCPGAIAPGRCALLARGWPRRGPRAGHRIARGTTRRRPRSSRRGGRRRGTGRTTAGGRAGGGDITGARRVPGPAAGLGEPGAAAPRVLPGGGGAAGRDGRAPCLGMRASGPRDGRVGRPCRSGTAPLPPAGYRLRASSQGDRERSASWPAIAR